MKFIKKNTLLIVLSMIMIIVTGKAIFEEKKLIEDNQQIAKENITNIENICKTDVNLEICQQIESFTIPTYSFFSLYESGLERTLNIFNEFFLIFFIIIITAIPLCKYMKNAIIKNENNRAKYKNILFKIFFQAFKYTIVPVIGLLSLYIFSYMTAGSLQHTATDIQTLFVGKILTEQKILYLICNILNTIFNFISLIGITILICRKEHNYILATIKSFITIIGIELFFEIIISGLILKLIFNVDYGLVFNIISVLSYDLTYGLWPRLLFNFIFMIIVIILIIYNYKDKEKFIIDCEKNF